MVITTKEWDDIPYHELIFYRNSSQEVLYMYSNTDEAQKVFSHNKFNANIMCVEDAILAAAAESGIDENWCLLNNQSTCNYFINGN